MLSILSAYQSYVMRVGRKAESLKRLVSQIDSPNFLWDLVIWVVVSDAYVEELLGDLNEEYLLQQAKHGEGFAKDWYWRQTTKTLRDSVWNTIDRIVAISSLIDLIVKLSRHKP